MEQLVVEQVQSDLEIVTFPIHSYQGGIDERRICISIVIYTLSLKEYAGYVAYSALNLEERGRNSREGSRW